MRTVRSIALCFVLLVTLTAHALATTRSGADLYRAACAACHAPDGRGTPKAIVGFATPLPDFTDCRFASREAQADWMAVVHSGGPVRGFEPMMPAFGDALSEDEIGRVLDHVKSFCTSRAWPAGELNLPRAFVTEKAYPEDEVVWTTTVETDGARAVTNVLVYERRFGARDQIEVAVPFGARRSDARAWSAGVGDIAIAAKHTVYHSLPRGRILSVGGEVSLPTGDRDDGFGSGVAIAEPFVAFGQVLPADGFLHLQTGGELPTDTDRADRELFWRAAIGKTFTQGRFGRAWSPMIEILGARALSTGARAEWDLLPQLQFTLNRRQHLMASAGVRVPLTEAGSRRPQLLMYLLWDWFDGGLLQGW